MSILFRMIYILTKVAELYIQGFGATPQSVFPKGKNRHRPGLAGGTGIGDRYSKVRIKTNGN